MELVFVDSDYAGDETQRAACKASRIRLSVVKRSDRQIKGFIVLPKRWVIERTFGWMNSAGHLAKDFETMMTSSQTWFMLALDSLLIRRIDRDDKRAAGFQVKPWRLIARPTGARLNSCRRDSIWEDLPMQSKRMLKVAITTGVFAVISTWAISAEDKYLVKVPNGLAFSEFRGYESWQVVSISRDGDLMAAILANPAMISAYLAGAPGNGTPFPDGAKLAKIHWQPKQMETFPAATVPGAQHDMDFMVKDSKRFADSGGWGWAAFEYDAASYTFRPSNTSDHPPQGNDAKCGFTCHTIVKARDYVFTDYGHR